MALALNDTSGMVVWIIRFGVYIGGSFWVAIWYPVPELLASMKVQIQTIHLIEEWLLLPAIACLWVPITGSTAFPADMAGSSLYTKEGKTGARFRNVPAVLDRLRESHNDWSRIRAYRRVESRRGVWRITILRVDIPTAYSTMGELQRQQSGTINTDNGSGVTLVVVTRRRRLQISYNAKGTGEQVMLDLIS